MCFIRFGWLNYEKIWFWKILLHFLIKDDFLYCYFTPGLKQDWVLWKVPSDLNVETVHTRSGDFKTGFSQFVGVASLIYIFSNYFLSVFAKIRDVLTYVFFYVYTYKVKIELKNHSHFWKGLRPSMSCLIFLAEIRNEILCWAILIFFLLLFF